MVYTISKNALGGEFAHQQIGMKEKVDERNHDHRSPDGRQVAAICPLTLHSLIFASAICGWSKVPPV
jgi:hypothetical protein